MAPGATPWRSRWRSSRALRRSFAPVRRYEMNKSTAAPPWSYCEYRVPSHSILDSVLEAVVSLQSSAFALSQVRLHTSTVADNVELCGVLYCRSQLCHLVEPVFSLRQQHIIYRLSVMLLRRRLLYGRQYLPLYAQCHERLWLLYGRMHRFQLAR